MKAVLRIDGLCCANCAAKIEERVQRIPGVSEANMSFMTQRLTIRTETGDVDSIACQASEVARKIGGRVTVSRVK